MKIVSSKQYKEKGFTIVELMIATMVFSTILVVITFGILHFTNSYYKGVNSSTTQDTARSIMDGVTQTIQFSGSGVNPTQQVVGGVSWFCAGYHTYVYLPGAQYDPSTPPSGTNPGLYVYANNGTCPTITTPPPLNLSALGGKELLTKNMRITAMNVSPPTNGAYTVSIVLAYGDRDLLCSSSLPASNGDSCHATSPNTSLTGSFVASDTQCRSTTGSQFCAVSSLSTTVYTRVGVPH